MIEKSKEYPNGLEKSLLIKLACVTSYRCSSLLNLTWDLIKKHDNNTYIVYAKKEAIGKRNKKDEKSIDKEFYEELLQLKDNSFDGKLFHMRRESAWSLIKKLVDDLELDPDGDRKLTFHSIRNYGANEIQTKTNDIRLVKQQLNHANEVQFLKNYARMVKDPAKNPSLMVLKDVDTSLLKDASLEQLLMAIDKCGDDVKVQLLNKLKEITG
jgi:integrase